MSAKNLSERLDGLTAAQFEALVDRVATLGDKAQSGGSSSTDWWSWLKTLWDWLVWGAKMILAFAEVWASWQARPAGAPA
jgi:hypothetical protein